MKPFYTPVNLIQARDEIIILHKKKSKPSSIHSASFKKWITKMSKTSENKIKQTAVSLSDQELYSIIGYLPGNSYSLEMESLFQIAEYRLDQDFCTYLFECWLRTYDNSLFNSFMYDLQDNEYLSALLCEYNLPKEDFYKILLNENIPLDMGKYLEQLDNASEKDFGEILPQHGIIKNSRLYKDIITYRFLYCKKKLYSITDKEYLCDLVSHYSNENFKQFLLNFLSALPLKELETYKSIAQYCFKKVGEPDKESYARIIHNFPSELEQKYIDWINCYQIYLHLGNDERGTFWRRYRYLSVRYYSASDCVMLECQKHCIIEFLGQASGPYYIFDKDYFNRIVKFHMNQTKPKLRQYLYHDTEYIFRNGHVGYWIPTAIKLIKENQITTTI